MRGSWNAQPYGPLYPLQVEGVARGTDLYFNKSTYLLTSGFDWEFALIRIASGRSAQWSLGRANPAGSMAAGERNHDAVFRGRKYGSVCGMFTLSDMEADC